jgi:hypothetical protein
LASLLLQASRMNAIDQAPPADDHDDEEAPVTQPMPGRTRGSGGMRVRTGVRAGDLYIQQPRGSNNGLNGVGPR